jgi:nitrilase
MASGAFRSFNIAATIEKLDKLTGIAASTPHSADIVVFPEAFVSCYPRGLDFGAVVGSRSPDGREWFLRCHESAVDIEGDSPEWQAIKQIAQEKQVILVLGVIEKDVSKHSTLFCTCVTIGRDGTLLAKHRKLMPTGSERLIWGQGDGSGLQITQTDVGKVRRAYPRLFFFLSLFWFFWSRLIRLWID